MIAEIETAPYQFTIGDYHRMGETGILSESKRFELINGAIYVKGKTASKEAACRSRLNYVFANRLVSQAIISIKSPIILSEHSEPEPDVTLLRNRDDFYEAQLPEAADVLLLIEVSEATLRFDKEVKLPLYAQNGITEVWIIDLKKSCIEVYTDPQDGVYGQKQILKRG